MIYFLAAIFFYALMLAGCMYFISQLGEKIPMWKIVLVSTMIVASVELFVRFFADAFIMP